MLATTKYGFSLWQGNLAHRTGVKLIAHIFNIEMMKPQNVLLMCHEAKLTVIGKTIFCCSGGCCLSN